MYWVRMVGGTLYLTGMLLLAFNVLKTIAKAPKDLPDPAFALPSSAYSA